MIPEIWPTPGNPETRVRASRMLIQIPLDKTPVAPGDPPRPRGITSTLDVDWTEATEKGTSYFEQPMPLMASSRSFVSLLTHKDPEVRQALQAVAWGLEIITYALYLEMKARIEEPFIPPIPPELIPQG